MTDEIAESLGMATAKGALVAGIIKGGPVDNGSIQPGDVIIKFDGKDVKRMRDLPRVVAESPVGKAVDVVIVRKGVEQTVKVTLGRLEDGEKLAEPKRQHREGRRPGRDRDRNGARHDGRRTQRRGAQEVRASPRTFPAWWSPRSHPNSLAAERGIVAGEVITEIAQESVSTPKEVMDRIAALKEQGRKNALLMLASKSGELRFVTIRMD